MQRILHDHHSSADFDALKPCCDLDHLEISVVTKSSKPYLERVSRIKKKLLDLTSRIFGVTLGYFEEDRGDSGCNLAAKVTFGAWVGEGWDGINQPWITRATLGSLEPLLNASLQRISNVTFGS